jgi:hypothetical protein
MAKRRKFIIMRVTPAELRAIKSVARSSGSTTSDVVRHSLVIGLQKQKESL